MSSLHGKACEWPSPMLTGDPCGLPLPHGVRGPRKPLQAVRRVPADHETRCPAAQCGEARGLSPCGDVGLLGPALSSLASPFKGQGSQRPRPRPVVTLMTTEPRTVRWGCQAEEPSVHPSIHLSGSAPGPLVLGTSPPAHPCRAQGAHSPEQPHGTGWDLGRARPLELCTAGEGPGASSLRPPSRRSDPLVEAAQLTTHTNGERRPPTACCTRGPGAGGFYTLEGPRGRGGLHS